ncbi:hypothetical protein K458DRAFT_346456 [Lentithecium fluviatile CBS 122367]|uniref:Uncharacterized protein n=1 Tax=Lentithecium fluviatile CBS 122367 TaxID=1168545 RepID=A0A6G1IN12_9PLEO|nr:hypothetical protein K458DRAFT_346456 [Lentithecium fluviatile CBS 122367]
MDVKMNDRPDKVKAALGYRDEQWHRFYWLTKEEARSLITAHPECLTYASFSATERIQLLDRLNAALAADGIPIINATVLKWRMTSLVREMRRKPVLPKDVSPSPQPPEASKAPFDPVRDT